MRKQQSELAKARDALDRGRVKLAVRRGWNSAIAAARDADGESLEAVVDLAMATRARTSGRVKKGAELLRLYSLASLEQVRSGIRPQSALSRLLIRRASEPATKTCPDCAETVKAAAKVCRFCGHRFA